MRKRDEDHDKHRGIPHAWVLLGTDTCHKGDGTFGPMDVWMCMHPNRCGRQTEVKDRQKHMDDAMCKMVEMITGEHVSVHGFAL